MSIPESSEPHLVEVPFLRTVGFVTTYQCQVRCPHCILRAGPERREVIRPGDGARWIDDIADYRSGFVRMLALTGGEPFFNLEQLISLSRKVAARGLLVSAVTNAFWATSPDKAVKTLASVPALRILSVSADSYHQLAIPLERVAHAVHAADILGIGCNINMSTEDESDARYQKLRTRLRDIVSDDRIQLTVTFPAGRASDNDASYPTTPDPPAGACCYAGSPIIFPDGSVIACIGPVIDLPRPHPFHLGNLFDEPASTIFDRAERNVLLHAIRLWGPGRLISILRKRGFDGALPESYVRDSLCCACLAICSKPALLEGLRALAGDADFAATVAYGRVYYLGETEMAESLESNQASSPQL